MFKKLVSNLPFNPSLIDQVVFYMKRLHKDALARRVGFVLICLTMLVQMFAVISPPQPTLAQSANDIVLGGFSNRDDAANLCRNNTNSFGDILNQFDISCDNIAEAKDTTIDSGDYNGQLMTIGRLAYGKKGETPLSIKGKTYWARSLKNWDIGSSRHQAIEGTSKTGQKFYIVKSCGGITFVSTPPAPKPKCEWNQTLLATDPKCFEPCPINGKQDIDKNSLACFESCPVAGLANLAASDPDCYEPCQINGKQNLSRDSALCYEPCRYNSDIASDNPNCQPCERSYSSDNQVACLLLTKTVSNQTTKLEDANNSTARPGQVISYTLSAQNTGSEPVDSFIIQENISDALDYAALFDTGGGTLDNQGVLAWGAVAIKPGETITKVFSIKIKDPLPSTPRSSSDPNRFDLAISNVYGNSTVVKLPASSIKIVEAASLTLPSTGPGAGLLAGFITTAIIGYFFARSRLMAKELSIIQANNTVPGGM